MSEIIQAAQGKFQINQKRDWGKPNEHGFSEHVDSCELRLCQSGDPAVVSVSEIIGDGAFRVGICQQCADELGLKDDGELPDFVTVKKMINKRPLKGSGE